MNFIEKNRIGIWSKFDNLTPEDVEKYLSNEFYISTESTEMVDGSLCWYHGPMGDIRCFGSGKQWKYQTDKVDLTNEESYRKISNIAKTQEILIMHSSTSSTYFLNKHKNAKNKIFTELFKEIYSNSIMIYGEIKRPKGDRVAPRVYISTQHITPKGGLNLNQKYKMIFIPVKEKEK